MRTKSSHPLRRINRLWFWPRFEEEGDGRRGGQLIAQAELLHFGQPKFTRISILGVCVPWTIDCDWSGWPRFLFCLPVTGPVARWRGTGERGHMGPSGLYQCDTTVSHKLFSGHFDPTATVHLHSTDCPSSLHSPPTCPPALSSLHDGRLRASHRLHIYYN